MASKDEEMHPYQIVPSPINPSIDKARQQLLKYHKVPGQPSNQNYTSENGTKHAVGAINNQFSTTQMVGLSKLSTNQTSNYFNKSVTSSKLAETIQ